LLLSEGENPSAAGQEGAAVFAARKEALFMKADGPETSIPRWQQWLFIVGLLLIFLLASIQYSIKAMKGGGAFDRWKGQIQNIEDGDDIYQHYNYPNPPIMALILEPLMGLPTVAGALCWFYLKVGMTLLALRWVFRLVEDPGRPFPPWAKALTVLLSLRPILGDLNHGNINLFILFLVVASLHSFNRRQDLQAGILLALSIACKVTPALFLPYFLWKRAWKTLAGCALGLVLFLWLVPAAFLGNERNATLLHSWIERMVLPYVVKGEVTTEHPNQSLPGLAFRLLTHSPSFVAYPGNRQVGVGYHNIIALDPDVVRWLVKGCMALFAGLVVWTCRTPTASVRSGWRMGSEFSLVVLGMLVFSERTWKHHCVTFMLPFAVLCYYLARGRPSIPLRRYLIATLAVTELLMAVTSTSLLDWVENGTAKLAQVGGTYVWAYLLLIAALAVILCRGQLAATIGGGSLELAGKLPTTGSPSEAA
jgi:hypothetical protein